MPGDAPAPTPAPGPTVEVLHAADAEDRQRRAAGALLAKGCSRGDRVTFALGSSADLICAALGAARVGLIPVMLNATLTSIERDDLAEDARPTVRVFTQRDLHDLIETGPPTELAPYPLTRPMHYTSGTTGKPKGVTTGLWDERTARQVFEDEASVWHFDAEDLHMVCSPMYHTVSIRFAGGTLLAGGSLAILSRFDAADRRSRRCGACVRRPPSSSRRICTACCRTPISAQTSASIRCASSLMPVRPAPTR